MLHTGPRLDPFSSRLLAKPVRTTLRGILPRAGQRLHGPFSTGRPENARKTFGLFRDRLPVPGPRFDTIFEGVI